MWHKIYTVIIDYRNVVEALNEEEARQKVLAYVLVHNDKLDIRATIFGGYEDLKEGEKDK
jgi:hypothetical protein